MTGEKPAAESRMERKKREVRQRIIDVGVDLFTRQGFHNTTMEQIAETADVARKTVYNHFPVKEAIADAYLREISYGLHEKCRELVAAQPDAESRMVAALTTVYDWVAYNPELSEVVLRYRMQLVGNEGAEHSQTGTMMTLEEIIRQGQDKGEIRREIPLELMVAMINMGRTMVFLSWIKNPEEGDLRERMVQMVDVLMHGILARPKDGPA